jgi:hypothetical protein
MDRHTGFNRARQGSAERQRAGFIVQMGSEVLHLVKYISLVL